MPVIVQLSLWDYLDTASKTPVDADLFGLLDRVEQSIEFLPTSEKLAVAGEAILRLGEIYGDRCTVTLAEIGYLAHPEREPCLALDAFDLYVRQSSFVDLEQFIESPELPEVERGYERGSVVRELSVAEALAEIKEPESESDAVDSKLDQLLDPVDLAHQEVDPLVRAEIDRYLQGRMGVSISELAEVLDLSPVAVLLTVMESYQLVGKGTVFYRRWEEIELIVGVVVIDRKLK
jgi:hypothetical protein